MYAPGAHREPQRQVRQRHWRLGAACLVMLGVAAVLGGLGRLLVSPIWIPSAPVLRAHLTAFPPVVLWAWERPETLNFIDARAIGVAFLARTLYLTGSDVVVRPRLQPFSAPPGTQLMAVVRMAADRWHPPDLSAAQREMAIAAIAEVGTRSGIQALQVDFDATVSQRAFYRELLHQLRRQLPAAIPLSMTALASWCMFDEWLAGLPVDEVVPMVFRMGADQHRVRRYLAADDFRADACRHSLGIATDEPLPTLRPGRRLYLFHPQAWRLEAMTSFLKEVGRWPSQP